MTSAARVLMCPPRALPPLSASQVWSQLADPLDPTRARAQWQRLRELVQNHIGHVIELPPAPWASAMTFTRDLGLLAGEAMVALEPPAPRGLVEPPIFARHMALLGIAVANPDTSVPIAGGNVLADRHGRLLIGKPPSADQSDRVPRELSELTGRAVAPVPIRGTRFPHLDMCLCDLGGKGWLCYPAALDGYGAGDPVWETLFAGLPVIELDAPDGHRLGCNLIVGDGVVIGSELSPRLRSAVEGLGIELIETPLDELVKAGGGARCLTLELPCLR